MKPIGAWNEFWCLYRSGAWEPGTKELVDGLLRPGDLFVDVGAWIGPVSLWALARGADVIAVEPDPVARRELEEVVPDAEIWAGAVAPEPGTLSIARRPDGEWGDSMSRIAGDGTAIEAWTLPEILDGRVPALVKIDIEGFEMQLLPSLGPWLAERGIPLQVSFHGDLPHLAWLRGYREVHFVGDPHGDLVALP